MLKEVWLDIGIERTHTHKGVTIKVLLDSGTTGMFMDRKIAAKHEFRLQKLERPVRVSQMVTYLICDLRKEFFKRVQARFR